MHNNLFPLKPSTNPQIYAYEDTNPQYSGLLKIGFTGVDVEKRIAEQYGNLLRPGDKPYKILFSKSSMRNDGSSFTDKDLHRYLRKKGFYNPEGEWFKCSVKDVEAAFLAVFNKTINEENRTQTFKMRPEQEEAVNLTAKYINSFKSEKNKTPHFLWNAKMRFGKTFAAYQLAKKLNYKRILVLTFKPAVENAWEEDLNSHVDFEGWQFISRHTELKYEQSDKNKPIVMFGSFQDFLGKNSVGGVKAKNEWVHSINWDIVIFDEYHYGAWRENAKDLFEAEDAREQKYGVGEGMEYFEEEVLPITTSSYLYLSGTPFRAIATGEFIEEQIYNWTYSDEQRAKQNWEGENNPYESLPKMVLLTYQMPDSIKQIAMAGEFNEFDLNVFFSATGEGQNAKFVYENEVQKWLDLIRGQYMETSVDNLKLGAKKPPMPFSDVRLLNTLSHTFWFLPSVASCYAMSNLLKQKQNIFYHEYNVVVAAGPSAGIGLDAIHPVQKAMHEPLKNKSITLSCGKLTTGVTIKPWTGIFMLRNSSSPETYFQAAFRVQSPWVIKNPDGLSPNKEDIIKTVCYVFDFAPDRALKQIADYSLRLNNNEISPEVKVADFINFLPVLAYDGSSMKQIDAAGILDAALTGTTATLLARRWESALLVNVDNYTLARLMENEKAMNALMNIEGFRSLNQDIETIINKSDAVSRAKKEANERDLSKEEKRQLTQEEKDYKSKRKQIQEKLIKFATRIPVFMYLTDFREETLKEVITKLEPGLFQKVTGLTVEDFELLVSLNVFNGPLMNDAVFKFKRYEDSSLQYTGKNMHEGEKIGGYDTSITYEELKGN